MNIHLTYMEGVVIPVSHLFTTPRGNFFKRVFEFNPN